MAASFEFASTALARFLNLGHALTHLVMLIFPTAVLALGPAWGIPYDQLMPASLGGLIAYGAGSLPSGWLGDHWNRRSMMAVFFIGVGAGSIFCGLARTPLEIAIALGIVGLFASIYHPVGLSLLVADPARLGRTLGINGVFGNLGIAGAAMVTGLLSDALGWRWAFIAPGLLSILAGFAFLLLVPALPKVEAKAVEKAKTVGIQSFTIMMAGALLLFIVCDSMVFNATTIALPKVAETRMSGWFEGPAAVGTIVSIVFAIAALAQLLIGHLIDRMPLSRIFLPLAAAQIVALLLMGPADGPWFIAAALATMFIVFGLIPISDAVIARNVSDSWRSRAYAISYVVAFGVGPAAVPLIAVLYDEVDGFPYLFAALAAISGGTLLAAIALRMQMRS
ncbi:MAG TPA: MFS transporter [Aestuariivirgaceae bacterium]|nr:MFS transporter [Aestuariivirgaceae bacterium]